ncbi:MAG TPA: DinB family protein [Anaerolineales bacterium]|nr:DinB family protein [Anaerolineales bacterium]
MTFQTKADILKGLQTANEAVTHWFEQIPAAAFFVRQGDIWSASDNMDHLIRANKPIIKAMKLPRLALQTMFGKHTEAGRSYEAVCAFYRAELAKGAVASGSFLPDQQQPDDPEGVKREILSRWVSVSAELVAQAEKWDEKDLDSYQLPHPLLGNLSMREMLYFTHYHNLRHASLEGD